MTNTEGRNEQQRRINDNVRSGAMNKSLGIDAETIARRTNRKARKPRANPVDGIDAWRAIGFLTDAGHGFDAIALATGRTLATVIAWHVGTRRPSPASLAALITMIDRRSQTLLARHDIREPRTAHELDCLDGAREALTTDAQRAHVAELVERWTSSKPASAATSITTQADPFELIERGNPTQAELPF